MSVVLFALVGIFGVMPFAFGHLQDDALRAEAGAASQRYLDDVRTAVQSGGVMPAPARIALEAGASMATGDANASMPFVDLSASCTRPDGPTSSLFDCSVLPVLDTGSASVELPTLETYVTRQL